jgi:hypothetical protein
MVVLIIDYGAQLARIDLLHFHRSILNFHTWRSVKIMAILNQEQNPFSIFSALPDFRQSVASDHLSPNNDRNHLRKMCYIFARNEIDTRESY